MQEVQCKLPAIAILLLAVVPLFVGCGEVGPEVVPVSGRVTLDGAPLENADLTFQPDGSKPPSFGRTEKDGTYVLAYKPGIMGARVGQHTVRIVVSREVVPNPPKISLRYNTESELREEVKSGKDNVINFDLKSDAE